jgi:hypothetical protein
MVGTSILQGQGIWHPKSSGTVKSSAYLLGDLLTREWHPSNPPRVSMRNGWLAGWIISGFHRQSLSLSTRKG